MVGCMRVFQQGLQDGKGRQHKDTLRLRHQVIDDLLIRPLLSFLYISDDASVLCVFLGHHQQGRRLQTWEISQMSSDE
jgi:hypothetical protein